MRQNGWPVASHSIAMSRKPLYEHLIAGQNPQDDRIDFGAGFPSRISAKICGAICLAKSPAQLGFLVVATRWAIRTYPLFLARSNHRHHGVDDLARISPTTLQGIGAWWRWTRTITETQAEFPRKIRLGSLTEQPSKERRHFVPPSPKRR
jgi:hypothetical protein